MHLWSRVNPYQPISTDARARTGLGRSLLSDQGARQPGGRRDRMPRASRQAVNEAEVEPVAATPGHTAQRLSSTLAILDITAMLEAGTATRVHATAATGMRADADEALDRLIAGVLPPP